jgi:hypothetical protein
VSDILEGPGQIVVIIVDIEVDLLLAAGGCEDIRTIRDVRISSQ